MPDLILNALAMCYCLTTVKSEAPLSELKQFSSPYMSTLRLGEILKNLISRFTPNAVVDLGCGVGAQINYLSKIYPDLDFMGLDYNPNMIALAKASSLNSRLTFSEFNIFEPVIPQTLKHSSRIGLISQHTLCCFESYLPFFSCVLGFDPDFIVVNSLFTDFDMDVLIHIRNMGSPLDKRDPDGDFNIFAKKQVSGWLSSRGYSVDFVDFFPDKKLEKPNSLGRGTYTIQTEWSPHTQFSGPVHLPWAF